jgi:hypothetical protein
MSETLTLSAGNTDSRSVPGWIGAIEVIAGIILVILSFNVWGYLLVAGVSAISLFGIALIIQGPSGGEPGFMKNRSGAECGYLS